MSDADNKKLVETYFDVIGGRNTEKSIDTFFAADVTWTVPQSNPMFESNPLRGHAAVMDLMTSGVGIYQEGSMAVKVEAIFAGDNRVCAQFTLDAVLADGTPYSNQYAMVFEVANGQFTGVWEYLDTLYQWRQGTFED